MSLEANDLLGIVGAWERQQKTSENSQVCFSGLGVGVVSMQLYEYVFVIVHMCMQLRELQYPRSYHLHAELLYAGIHANAQLQPL
jgi:hypothetical protein